MLRNGSGESGEAGEGRGEENDQETVAPPSWPNSSSSSPPILPLTEIKAEPLIEDLVFQQHMMQMKQQQLIQQQLLEDHYQKNRALLQTQHEKQISVFLQQLEQQRVREEAEKQRDSRVRLDVLRQKDEMCQSAVASPEVKRRLQEVILQRKRREAAASMGNLQAGIPVSSAPAPPTALLRKVQSESNLLKIKTKRGERGGCAPYSRTISHHLQFHHPFSPWSHYVKLVPEASAVSGSEDSTPSPISGQSALSVPLGSPATVLPLREASQSPGSSPGSPHSILPAPRPSPLVTSVINSRSLPNIPSSLDSRRSPPAQPQHRTSHGPHRRNFLEKSHSVAILPLRRHLMQRSMAERKSMDDNQYYYQKEKLERERVSRGKLILPLEEVMEEEQGGHSHSLLPAARRNVELMDTEVPGPSNKHFTPFVGVGPSGISPLVLSDPRLAGHCTSFQPAARLASPPEPCPSHRTGLAFHPAMLKHQCVCENGAVHPENPERLQFLLSRLRDTGLLQDCVQVSTMGSLEQVQSCHTEAHTLMFGTQKNLTGQNLARDVTLSKLTVLQCGGLGVDSDTYWNELHTASAAKSAVGCVVELTDRIASAQLSNGFALVRPPGHHAEAEEAMGFCYFNNVAIAAKQLLKRPDMRRLLIIDWAIHHGNGTQKVFYEDPRVLYISLHRHDNGNFYPGTGGSTECGASQGLGTNVNIAWSGGLEPPMGDAEYLAAFRTVVLPIARDFMPDLVLVSAGFDAGLGHEHPIGGYRVSPACWAYLTRQLLGLAGGRVALVLEGGYNMDTLADSVEQCSRALMGLSIEKIPHEELARRPCVNAVDTLQKTMAIQGQYWPCLAPQLDSAKLSHFESWGRERVGEESRRAAVAGEARDGQAAEALSLEGLSVQQRQQQR